VEIAEIECGDNEDKPEGARGHREGIAITAGVVSLCHGSLALKSNKLLKKPEKAFFRGFRQKSADAEGAKAHSLRELYAGALRTSG
jgi:hypothetical protein